MGSSRISFQDMDTNNDEVLGPLCLISLILKIQCICSLSTQKFFSLGVFFFFSWRGLKHNSLNQILIVIYSCQHRRDTILNLLKDKIHDSELIFNELEMLCSM